MEPFQQLTSFREGLDAFTDVLCFHKLQRAFGFNYSNEVRQTCEQGEQIGRFDAYWVIVYFG
jgi:hypothetical protein